MRRLFASSPGEGRRGVGPGVQGWDERETYGVDGCEYGIVAVGDGGHRDVVATAAYRRHEGFHVMNRKYRVQ